ncbi:hypothetical protein LTR17_021340 [Elasticomyces elasticus]|nr:hypothetical protein LTR17_021340 [Elasticomyces elasticus]
MAVEPKATQSQGQGDKVAKKPTASMQTADEISASSAPPRSAHATTKTSNSEDKAASRVEGAPLRTTDGGDSSTAQIVSRLRPARDMDEYELRRVAQDTLDYMKEKGLDSD